MNLEKANEVLKTFTDAVSTVNSELSQNKYKIKRLEGFEEKYKEIEKEMHQLKGIERIYNLVKNFTTVDVCPDCDGHGGFVYDMGEAGCEGEERKNCESTGLVSRVILKDYSN